MEKTAPRRISTKVTVCQDENPALHSVLAGIKPHRRARRLNELAIMGWALEQGQLQIHSGRSLPVKPESLEENVGGVRTKTAVSTDGSPSVDATKTEARYLISDTAGDDISSYFESQGMD